MPSFEGVLLQIVRSGGVAAVEDAADSDLADAFDDQGGFVLPQARYGDP